MKLRDASLQDFRKKTLSHILCHVISLHFLRMHHDYFFGKGFESVQVQFLSVESSITCNLPVQSRFMKPTIFMLNMAFDVLLSAVFAKDGKLESFVSCNVKLFALCSDMYFFIKTLLFSIMVIITFYFDICIKLILSTIISTRKEWHSADSRHSGNIR